VDSPLLVLPDESLVATLESDPVDAGPSPLVEDAPSPASPWEESSSEEILPHAVHSWISAPRRSTRDSEYIDTLAGERVKVRAVTIVPIIILD
jgi:hypothetical protein